MSPWRLGSSPRLDLREVGPSLGEPKGGWVRPLGESKGGCSFS